MTTFRRPTKMTKVFAENEPGEALEIFKISPEKKQKRFINYTAVGGSRARKFFTKKANRALEPRSAL